MRYLTAEDVNRINEAEVGPDLLLDFGLLESAVLRPQQTVKGEDAYPNLASKAAALMESLVRNQPVPRREQAHGGPGGDPVPQHQWRRSDR